MCFQDRHSCEKCKHAMAIFTLSTSASNSHEQIPRHAYIGRCLAFPKEKVFMQYFFAMGTECKWLCSEQTVPVRNPNWRMVTLICNCKNMHFLPGGGQIQFNKTLFITGKVLTQKDKQINKYQILLQVQPADYWCLPAAAVGMPVLPTSKLCALYDWVCGVVL